MELQFNSGNFVDDNLDVRRNGLRAVIKESEYDYSTTSGSQAGFWARMNADWLFNGHLKSSGSVSLYGVVAPICEGDNVQARGVVYHIENVSHSGSLGSDGKKSFNTILTVSNGILASSLTGEDQKTFPSYPCHSRNTYRPNIQYTPGLTDVQLIPTSARRKPNRRKPNGDLQ